jgi:hypothetical protein
LRRGYPAHKFQHEEAKRARRERKALKRAARTGPRRPWLRALNGAKLSPAMPDTPPPESPRAATPPVTARDVLCMSPHAVAIHRDLSAHAGLNYRILSLMPANDVVVHFGLT